MMNLDNFFYYKLGAPFLFKFFCMTFGSFFNGHVWGQTRHGHIWGQIPLKVDVSFLSDWV